MRQTACQARGLVEPDGMCALALCWNSSLLECEEEEALMLVIIGFMATHELVQLKLHVIFQGII